MIRLEPIRADSVWVELSRRVRLRLLYLADIGVENGSVGSGSGGKMDGWMDGKGGRVGFRAGFVVVQERWIY